MGTMGTMGRRTASIVLFVTTCLACSVKADPASPIRTQTVLRPALDKSSTAQNNRSYESPNATYAWSSWGAWGACSRTCGGGVAVQERQCLPSDLNTNRWLRGRKRRRLSPHSADNSLNRRIPRTDTRHHIHTPSAPPDSKHSEEDRKVINKEYSTSSRSNGEKSHNTVFISEFRNAPHEEFRRDYNKRQKDNLSRSIKPLEFRSQRERTRNYNETRLKRSRRSREEHSCRGLAKRYHECNTAPCGGPIQDSRMEQCASYDRRPFKGRFYTWVPYVDADSPCTLNCRPRGQQFYASLALVADGTPCTRPGFRAICVQGTCKVVGREGVLSTAASRDPRCGHRLVSGLFTRPRLPLGYSHIATVPPGACRLNISELQPSENYIALKLTNGSYIMNGEFAVSAPGTYEAAGALFVYKRGGGFETIYSHGPTMQSVDIMILYQHPNPSIKYEYLTDTLPDEAGAVDNTPQRPVFSPEVVPAGSATRHQHRHHNSEAHTKSLTTPNENELPNPNENTIESGVRSFSWKILSFTACSRTCGGGIQIGKFKCVEEGNPSREVSPVHCIGVAPSTRRRRCNVGPCAPRWRTTAWSSCPVCGPATQSRNVGCVQDHSKGLTKISDSKCTPPMPPISQPCDIPDCTDGNSISNDARNQDPRRQAHDRGTEYFHAASRSVFYRPANRTNAETDNEISSVLGPETIGAVGGWLYTEWSECVGWCVGGGIRTRNVRCADPAGCSPHRTPTDSESCTPRKACEPHTAHWFTGEWSPCSAECGGKQVRAVVCLGGAGRKARDSACTEPKPQTQRACGADCKPSWFLSDWSQCTGVCGAGVQSRTVWCARRHSSGDSGGAFNEEKCGTPRPTSRRGCDPPRCDPSAPVAQPSIQEPRTYATSPRVFTARSHLSEQSTVAPDTRIPRREIQSPQASTEGQNKNNAECTDRLSSCTLAVQARLCHYHYYSVYCCRSCAGKP